MMVIIIDRENRCIKLIEEKKCALCQLLTGFREFEKQLDIFQFNFDYLKSNTRSLCRF